MKYQNNEHKTEFLGEIQSMGGLGIKMGGKAFQALTSNLYSNPKGAIVRELACNAWDAHRLADELNGTDTQRNKPFDVHLPTELEPFFYIRDYGPGMSHETMNNVYRIVFESTKDESDDDIGCFGLGSKTPLAYNTKSFVVVSYQKGKERSYTCFFREDGVPDLAFQDEKDSNEEDGIKVYVACRKEDIYSFRENAQNFLKHFKKPQANILNPSFEFKKEEVVLKGRNGEVLKNERTHIVMGNVPYYLNTSSFRQNVSQKALSSTETIEDEFANSEKVFEVLGKIYNKGMGFRLHVPIGKVTPQLSREELYYDENTCDNLYFMFKELIAEFSRNINEKINECAKKESYFEACMSFTNISERLFSFMSKENISHPVWEGDIPSLYPDAFNGWLVRSTLNLDNIGIQFDYYARKRKRRTTSVKKSIANFFFLNYVFITPIFISDEKDSISRIRDHLKSYPTYNGLCYEKVCCFNPNDFERFCELLGINEELLKELKIIYASELPKPATKHSNFYRPKEGRVTKHSIRAGVDYCLKDGVYDLDEIGNEKLVYDDEECTVVYFNGDKRGNRILDLSLLKKHLSESFVGDMRELNSFNNIRSIENSILMFGTQFGLYDDVKVITIKGNRDSRSFKKAEDFGWLSGEEYVVEWIKENFDLMSKIQRSVYAKNCNIYNSIIPSEILETKPKLKEIYSFFKNIDYASEDEQRLPYFKCIPNSPNLRDITEKINDIKEVVDFINAFHKVGSTTLRIQERDAIKKSILFHLNYGFDEDLKKIDFSVKKETECEEETEETEEAEECLA